jgi:hypothetical protein
VDVWRLMDAVPHFSLAKAGSGLCFLRKLDRDCGELQSVLLQYPFVKYEPLDFVYVSIQSLAVLNENLVADLTRRYQWRGIVWAAWLAALSPDEKFVPLLQDAFKRAPHNTWIIDLALSQITGVIPAELAEHGELIAKIRNALQPLSRPNFTLRLAPNEYQVEQTRIDTEILRECYHARGPSYASKMMAAYDFVNFRHTLPR